MKSRRAFTLMEVLVVISIIALLMAILVPALGLARRTANNMQSQTQLRAIQNSFVIYAERNNDWYPGVDAQGNATYYDHFLSQPGGPGSEGAEAGGAGVPTPGAVTALWLLLREAYLTPEDLVSPTDDFTMVFVPQTFDASGRFSVDLTGVDGEPIDPWGPGNYSYATLEIAAPVPALARRLWRANGNAQLPIASDRAIDNDNDGTVVTNAVTSIHTNPAEDDDDWNGFIVWNDGHVTRDLHFVTTRLTDETPNNNDDLFAGGAADVLLQHDQAGY